MTKPLLYILALVALCLIAAPEAAFAQSPPAAQTQNTPTSPCVRIEGSGEYSAAVVHCVQTSIQIGVIGLLAMLSIYMQPVVMGLATLAIVLLGVRIMSGEQQLAPHSMGLFLRIGLVMFFGMNLGGYASAVFEILAQLVQLVTGGTYTPWARIDTLLGRLLGFGKHANGDEIMLFNGILGLLGGSLFSSVFGILLFFIGISAVITLVLMVFQVVHLYLASLVIIGFLIVISPIIIPLAIFNYGDRYVRQWINLLLSALLVPMMVFAFIWIFLGILDSFVAEIFNTIGGDNNLASYLHTNRPLLSWLIPTDPNTVHQLGDLSQARPAGVTGESRMFIPPVQTFGDPNSRFNFDSNMANPPIVDFGPQDSHIKQNLIYSFLGLWLFASLMKSMLNKIPQVANNIAGAGSGVTLGMSSLQQTMQGFNDKMMNLGRPQDKASTARPPMKNT